MTRPQAWTPETKPPWLIDGAADPQARARAREVHGDKRFKRKRITKHNPATTTTEASMCRCSRLRKGISSDYWLTTQQADQDVLKRLAETGVRSADPWNTWTAHSRPVPPHAKRYGRAMRTVVSSYPGVDNVTREKDPDILRAALDGLPGLLAIEVNDSSAKGNPWAHAGVYVYRERWIDEDGDR